MADVHFLVKRLLRKVLRFHAIPVNDREASQAHAGQARKHATTQATGAYNDHMCFGKACTAGFSHAVTSLESSWSP